jgi:hypothetical protein
LREARCGGFMGTSTPPIKSLKDTFAFAFAVAGVVCGSWRQGWADGLWLHDRDCGSARGTVLNAVKMARCCCCAAGLGVAGHRRHSWTSSHSASLSSSVAEPLPSRSSSSLPTMCAAQFFFVGRGSACVLLARRLPSLRVPAPAKVIAMRSSTEDRAGVFGGEFFLSESSEVFFGELSERSRGVRGCQDGAWKVRKQRQSRVLSGRGARRPCLRVGRSLFSSVNI